MPALGRTNKPARVETAQERRKRRSRRHTPSTTPSARPGPFTDAERRSVARNRNTRAYQEALRQARLHGPATRRGTSRLGGDDKSAADRARGPAYVRGLYEGKAKLYQPGTTVPPDVRLRTGYRLQRESTAQVSAPVLAVLDTLSRPIHAIAGAAKHDVKMFKKHGVKGLVGHGSLEEARKGFRNETKNLFSDVLDEAGVENKIIKAILGTGLDIALDPTTYVTFGTSSAARKIAEVEGRRATQAALKAGASKKAADRAGRAAAQKALKTAPTGRGLTVGFAGMRTSGATTARIDRKLGLDRAGEKVRGSLPGRMVRHVAPRVRPAGVSEKDWQAVRTAVVRGRAATSTGEKRARSVAQAIARALPGDSHAKVIDALEEMGSPPPRAQVTEQFDEATQKSIARRSRLAPGQRPVRRKGAVTGTPELAAKDAEWFHGTPREFEGMPSAQGQWSDLGVYLTSDPKYAKAYASGSAAPGAHGSKGGRLIPIRVNPKRVLDMRAGQHNADDLLRVIGQMKTRAENAVQAELKRDPYGARHREPILREGMVGRLEQIEAALRSGKQMTVAESRYFQSDLQELSQKIGEYLGRKGTGNRHQVLAESVREAGFDAVRKVDQTADALVVLDEKIMRRATGREGAPTSRTIERVAGGADPLAGLTDAERKVVLALRREFDDIYRAESGRGLVGRKFRDFGYFPRRPLSELEPGGSRRRMSGAQLVSSKQRTNRKRYSEFRGTADDIYTQNAAVATYLRGRDSAVKVGRKIVIDELHRVGRRFHPGAQIRDGEAIYKFTADGRKMPEEVGGDELKSLLAGGAPPGQNEYRVLNRDLFREADHSVPKKLEDLEEIGRIWDRQVQGRVKTVLTVINPQYHATNMYGDLWKAYTEAPAFQLLRNLGISAQALAWKAKREAASKTLGKVIDPADKGVRVDGKKMTWDTLVKEAEDHGAISQGFIARDLADTLDAQGKEAAERMGRGKIARHTRLTRRIASSRVGSRALHPIDTVRDMSQYREDWVRLALYAGRRRKGATADEAADFANRTLIDYGDLSTFERSVLRRVMPFYTFTARNTPQQVSALARRPGKFANLEKVREEALKASGLPEDYQDQIREFEQRGIPVPLPGEGGKMLFPKLPAMDLNRLSVSDQGDYMVAMLSPLLKSPIEWDQNYSFFFREHIDPLLEDKGPNGETVRTLRPAPRWLIETVQKLPQGRKLTEALHIRQYKDKRTGKTVWGWPARLDYLLKQTPLSGTALQFGTDVPNTRGQTQEQRLLGYITGLKVAPFEAKAVKERELGQEYGFLQAKARAMRDQGDAYDAEGNRTRAYQQVLDRTRAVAKDLGVYDKRKKPSALSGDAQAALESLQSTSGPQLSPDAKAALESLSP